MPDNTDTLCSASQLSAGPIELTDWRLPEGARAVILGGNGSGKSSLARLLTGNLPIRQGQFNRPGGRVVWVSQETQQALYEEELRRDESDLTDVPHEGTPVIELLEEITGERAAIDDIAENLGLTAKLAQGYRSLSSGEGRRVVLARAILTKPELLILEEPFEGLDRDSREQLRHQIFNLVARETAVLLLLGHHDDIPASAQQLGLLARGHLVTWGSAEDVQANPDWQAAVDLVSQPPPAVPARRSEFQLPGWEVSKPLVELHHGTVRHGEALQFSGVDWTLQPGEHTQIAGPNGCGKSTLLHLITGDHPQCYANDLTVFGFRRGTGESIWDIKRHIGYVSNDLHRNYRVQDNAITTVLSGLTDSIGLYEAVGDAEIHLAQQWLNVIGLADRANDLFRALSAGEQRLILIARALIKQPPLLILDEPTQGLDDLNRFRMLTLIDRIIAGTDANAGTGTTTLLFVSHREDECPGVIQRRLVFAPEATGRARFAVFSESV